MSTTVAREAAFLTHDEKRTALWRSRVALFVGTAAAIALAAINVFATTSSDDGKFHHLGDYLLTADGIPYMLALLVLLPSMRALQDRRGGAFGRAGVVVASVGAAILLVMFVYGLIAATGSSLGPTYVLASLATLVGVVLFAVGAWRAKLLPRWLVVVWPLAWLLGSALPIPGPGPLVLAAAYIAIAVTLPRRLAAARRTL